MNIPSFSKSKPSVVDIPVLTSEELLEAREREIQALKGEISLRERRYDHVVQQLEVQDDSFDFSQLWRDEPSSKLEIVPIISLVLSFIVLIVVLVKG